MKNKPNIDLSHRLSVAQIADRADLSDTVGLMLERALGVLHALSTPLESKSAGRLSDALMAGAINSVIFELMDIQATVDAYCDAEQVKEPV